MTHPRLPDSASDAARWLELVLDASDAGVWELFQDPQRIVWDARCARLLGPCPPGGLSPEGMLERVHPDDRARARACMEALLAGEPLAPYEMQLASGDTWVSVAARVWAGKDGGPTRRVGTLRDVSGVYRNARALEQQRKLLLAMSDNATLGLMMMDARGHCTFMNPAAERLTGVRFQDTQGRPLHDVVHHTRPDGRPYPLAECPIDRALPERMQEQGSDVFVRPDGTFYPVAFTASPILENGAPVGTVIEVRDVTEEQRAAAEREALLEREQAARQEAERAVQLRDEFLSIASHELKTPLTPVQLRLQRLERRAEQTGPDGVLPAVEVGSELHGIARQVRRLATLIEGLLDVSRISAGKLTLERERVDLAALTREVLQRFEPEASRVRSELTLDLARAVEGAWDRARLEQVLSNLLSNAIKYGAGRGIRVGVHAAGPEAVLWVEDAGIGISPEVLPRIFERFERGVSERNYGGLGLGLYITRQIVEAHGGRVTAESVLGQGARFEVVLPLEAPR